MYETLIDLVKTWEAFYPEGFRNMKEFLAMTLIPLAPAFIAYFTFTRMGFWLLITVVFLTAIVFGLVALYIWEQDFTSALSEAANANSVTQYESESEPSEDREDSENGSEDEEEAEKQLIREIE